MSEDVKSFQTKIFLIKWLFKIKLISDISLHLKYRECRAEERDFLKIGFPNISINSNLSILQKMLTLCLQMQQKNLKNHNWLKASDLHSCTFKVLLFSSKENLCCWEIENTRQIQIISFIRVHYHVVFFWGDMIMWQQARTIFSRSYLDIC